MKAKIKDIKKRKKNKIEMRKIKKRSEKERKKT